MTPSAESGGHLVVEAEPEDGRYDRQELITWWDQRRLAGAKILVVGAGALGNELVKNLALLGVGVIVVVDMDVVENSNLSRCVLFRESDEGRNKAEVVAEAAELLNPDTRVVPVVGDVRVALGLGVFDAVDIVLGGLDSREARLHVNQACWKTSTPWIDGAIEGLMGVMRVFVPPDSACYECTMSTRDHEIVAARRACSLLTRDELLGGKVPTTATSASIIGAMQVQEAVKLLHRPEFDYRFAGQGVAYNGATHDSYPVTYGRHDACLAHDTYDLAAASDSDPSVTFGEHLAALADTLGAPEIELELDIVSRLVCETCDTVETVNRPLVALRAADALCPTCGTERHLDLFHTVSPADRDLLGLTPRDVGLPATEILTVRDGEERVHIRLQPRAATLDSLGRAILSEAG
jgi:adenylyltransferase/sulfurtransferase